MKTIYRIPFIAFLIFYGSSISFAQNDSILQKGRFTTSLFGFISSSQSNSGNASFTGNTISYTIATKTGILFANRWAGGLSLSLNRSETDNLDFSFNEEQFLIGLWTRWYFIHQKNVGLYADVNPYFISIDQQLSQLDTTGLNVETKGTGLGISPGIGFVFFVNRNIGFSMQLDYFISTVSATRRNRFNSTEVKEDIDIKNLRFSFGFQVYLDEFFF